MIADELTAEALGLRPDLDVAPIYVAAQQTAAALRKIGRASCRERVCLYV